MIAVLGKGGYDGIRMMARGGFSAVDIDNCIVYEKLTETARDIVNTVDSYTETNPPGNPNFIV